LAFDTQPVGSATTNGAGAFGPTSITVPSSAPPGRHRIVATGETSGLTAQAIFTIRVDWPQFRFSPDHTRTNPFENVLGPTTVGGLVQRWSVATGGDVISSPAVVNGVAYFGSNDLNVYAVNTRTATVLWTFPTFGVDLHSSPAVAGGVVYI